MSSNKYSAIRQEPSFKLREGHSMSAFYDAAVAPSALLVTIVGFFAIVNHDIVQRFEQAAAGDPLARLHFLLLGLSLLAGARVVHSIVLARRDYAHLENGLMDIVVFVIVLLFLSGGAISLAKGKPMVVLLIYAICALVGSVNFYRLWRSRIPSDSTLYDYPIERRIQGINTFVFVAVTALLLAAIWIYHASGPGASLLYWVIAATFPLLLFNMVHSHQLTMAPKFLVQNAPDAPQAVVRSIRDLCEHLSPLGSDGEVSALLGDHVKNFRALHTERASVQDAERIVTELLGAFSYIFEDIFGTQDRSILRRTLLELVRLNGGLGAFGYLNFYFLVDSDTGEKVGLYKVDFLHGSWSYRWPELWALPLAVARGLGTPLGLLGVRNRARKVLGRQGQLARREMRLAYLIVFQEFRGQGYGRAMMHLLVNAFLRNTTNDVFVDRMSLFVRQGNRAARQLFANAGLAPVETKPDNSTFNPIAMGELGPLVLMERRRSTTGPLP